MVKELKSNWLAYLFILFCAVLPWSLAAMQIAAGLVVAGSIVHAILRRESPVQWHPFFIFLGIYVFVQLFTVVFSPEPAVTLNAIFHQDWFILMVPFIISLPLSIEWRRRAVQTLIGSAALVAAYGIFQFFFGMEIYRHSPLAEMGHFYRAMGGYNFYLTFAGNQLMVLGMAFAFFTLSREEKNAKWFYFAAMVLIFLSVISTFGRSTWIGTFFILLLGSWLLNRRLFIIFGVSLAVAGLFLAAVSPEIQQRLLSIFDPAQNEGRLNIWRTAWAMFKDHPLVGIGNGLFNQLFPQYRVPGFYDAMGHAHNDYLNFAVNSGILGLMAWVAMWISWFYYTLKAFRQKLLSGTDNKIIFGSMLSIAGILVAAFFQCYFTDLENNILWWLLASLSLMVSLRNDIIIPDRIDTETGG